MLHLHDDIFLEACSAITIAPAEWTYLLHFLGCSFGIPNPFNNVLDQNIHLTSVQCQESTYKNANNHKIILRKPDIINTLQRYEEMLTNHKTTILDFQKIPFEATEWLAKLQRS